MKTIFIRGLPGTGKSSIASALVANLANSKLISVDQYKLEAGKTGLDFQRARQYAYNRTVEEIRAANCDYLITEELICDSNFYQRLAEVCQETSSYWFRINRPIEQLLEVEQTRKRKIKNSYQDFLALQSQMDAIQIPGEIQIDNQCLESSLKRILEIVK